jgi:hypothetical protein
MRILSLSVALNHQYPVNIEFAESGKDADWTIR